MVQSKIKAARRTTNSKEMKWNPCIAVGRLNAFLLRKWYVSLQWIFAGEIGKLTLLDSCMLFVAAGKSNGYWRNINIGGKGMLFELHSPSDAFGF
jgi:hypothetical protein